MKWPWLRRVFYSWGIRRHLWEDTEDYLAMCAMQAAFEHERSFVGQLRQVEGSLATLRTRRFRTEVGVLAFFLVDYLLATEVREPGLTETRERASERVRARVNSILTNASLSEIESSEWAKLVHDRTESYAGMLGPPELNDLGVAYSPIGVFVSTCVVSPGDSLQYAISLLVPDWLAGTTSYIRESLRGHYRMKHE